MADLRQAAQQMLEAIDSEHPDIQLRAAVALRAVLAQEEQEPVAKYSDIVSDGGMDPRNKFDHPPRREWYGLKEWEINDGRDQLPTEDLCGWSFRQGAYFAEAKLKEKNNG